MLLNCTVYTSSIRLCLTVLTDHCSYWWMFWGSNTCNGLTRLPWQCSTVTWVFWYLHINGALGEGFSGEAVQHSLIRREQALAFTGVQIPDPGQIFTMLAATCSFWLNKTTNPSSQPAKSSTFQQKLKHWPQLAGDCNIPPAWRGVLFWVRRGAGLICFLTGTWSGDGSVSSLNADMQSDALRGVEATSHGGRQAHCKQQAEKTEMIDGLLCFALSRSQLISNWKCPTVFQNSDTTR